MTSIALINEIIYNMNSFLHIIYTVLCMHLNIFIYAKNQNSVIFI